MRKKIMRLIELCINDKSMYIDRKLANHTVYESMCANSFLGINKGKSNHNKYQGYPVYKHEGKIIDADFFKKKNCCI